MRDAYVKGLFIDYRVKWFDRLDRWLVSGREAVTDSHGLDLVLFPPAFDLVHVPGGKDSFLLRGVATLVAVEVRSVPED